MSKKENRIQHPEYDPTTPANVLLEKIEKDRRERTLYFLEDACIAAEIPDETLVALFRKYFSNGQFLSDTVLHIVKNEYPNLHNLLYRTDSI